MENAVPEKQSAFATEPIGRLIVRFAVPSVIALLVNSLYNIVDQIFIGWGVGYLGNGATNIVFPITIIALALSMMIGNGGAAYLSLKPGEGKGEEARNGVLSASCLRWCFCSGSISFSPCLVLPMCYAPMPCSMASSSASGFPS